MNEVYEGSWEGPFIIEIVYRKANVWWDPVGVIIRHWNVRNSETTLTRWAEQDRNLLKQTAGNRET
jgi:hypothetical protein